MALVTTGAALLAAARGVLEGERVLLRQLGVPGELVLVGGSSVVGAVTRGDVDLHLRVPSAAFPAATSALRRTHPVVHPEIWAPSLATFEVEAPLPAGLAVTPVGSGHDLRFTRTWQLLREDSHLLALYNAAKDPVELADGDYERRKAAFFEWLLNDRTGTGDASRTG